MPPAFNANPGANADAQSHPNPGACPNSYANAIPDTYADSHTHAYTAYTHAYTAHTHAYTAHTHAHTPMAKVHPFRPRLPHKSPAALDNPEAGNANRDSVSGQ